MQHVLNIMPAIKYLPEFDPSPNIKAITYDGMPIGDKKTKVFAYIGYPKSVSPNNKVPAVVLVHGGGGHAYFKWVRIWNDLGYAAIAMDTTGYYPNVHGAGSEEGDNDKWTHGLNEEGYTNAPDNDGMSTSSQSLDTQWMYHAVADTILAHNILRADKRVDSDKIGITGISWGGVITSIAIGHDNRYAFAIPIYGAGYLSEDTGFIGPHFQDEMTKKLWSAEHNFDKVTMPVFWFNWDSDPAFSANITEKCYNDTVKNNPRTIMMLKKDMNHSHHHGWIAEESYQFADSVIGK